MRLLVIGVFAPLLLVGCDLVDSERESFEIRTQKTLYALGQSIEIVAKNKTSSPIRMVTGCSYVLQEEEGGRWNTVSTRFCPPNARIGAAEVRPGEMLHAEILIPAEGVTSVQPSRIYRLSFIAFRKTQDDLPEGWSASNSFRLYRSR